MIVTIWRHGEAGSATSDELRELTRQGQIDVANGAASLRNICRRKQRVQPEGFWCSRWVRTTQTADIAQQQFPDASRCNQEALIPGASPADVEQALQVLWALASPLRHLILVSHQPLVSWLTDHLLGEPNMAPPLPPGGLVSLQLAAPDAGCARLLWWAFPPDYDAQL